MTSRHKAQLGIRYGRFIPIVALVVACATSEAPAPGGDGTPDSGGCCTASGSCDNASVAECVCAQDDFCCSEAWDETCVQNVTAFGCGTCAGTSATGSSWGGGSGSDLCSGQSDGAFCGTELPGGGNPSIIYTCLDGTTVSEMPCDLCVAGVCDSQGSDPCAGAPGGYGEYCGAELPQGNPTLIYSCASGITATTSVCNSGCALGVCNSTTSDPCVGAYAGDGKYCGSGLPDGDPSTLYTCSNQTTTAVVTCSGGCTEMPPGTPDQCTSGEGDPCSGANGGNGPYCGASLPGGDPTLLYTCTNLVTTTTEPCPSGCQINPPGTADFCK